MTKNTTHVGKTVELAALTKRYSGVTAVQSVDIAIEAGEFCTLLGPSGSGKTTLLRIIAGYDEATSGTIRIGGREVADIPVARRNIGMVFQNYALFPHMTVAENISFPLEMRGIAPAERSRKVETVIDLIGLRGLAGRLPRQLSGGQQQRVAVARALVFDPDILLMDEPLGALDKNLRTAMQSEIRALHRRIGVTIVYVTHDQEEAMNMSDRVVVMNHGRVEQSGSPATLYNRPANAFVARFLGECTLLPMTVDPSAGGFRLKVADGAIIRHADGAQAVTGPMLAGIRPERLRIFEGYSAGWITFPARVLDVSFTGPDYRVELSAQGADLTLRAPNFGTPPARLGQDVLLGFQPQDVFLVPLPD
jgi:putative spermidine/putrescine transport system ATP-binding protein